MVVRILMLVLCIVTLAVPVARAESEEAALLRLVQERAEARQGLGPSQDLAAVPQAPPAPPADPATAVDKEVITGWACVATGAAGTTLAMIGGSENMINVIAGGIVPTANPIILYASIAGVIFTSFCTLGESLAPLYIHYFMQ